MLNLISMKIIIAKPYTHSRNLLRRAGYALHTTREGNVSYVKRIHGDDYPRFHLYVNKEEPGKLMELSLHLDEKRPSYAGHTAHSGEYEGEIIEQERNRILGTISN